MGNFSDMRPGRLVGLVALGCWLAACVALRQPMVILPPPIPGASFVGNGACADCHEAISRLYPESPHGRLHGNHAGGSAATGCESCHGPGSLHAATPGQPGLIAAKGAAIDSCSKCHQEVAAAFRLPHHHPTINGTVVCTDCHDPHGRSAIRTAAKSAVPHGSEACASCHQQQAAVHVYEHEALRQGCAACHAAHGSINRGLLQAAESSLCLRCHAQVADPGLGAGQLAIGKRGHSFDVRGSTCWTAGCHTAVHGSNASPKLLY